MMKLIKCLDLAKMEDNEVIKYLDSKYAILNKMHKDMGNLMSNIYNLEQIILHRIFLFIKKL